MKNMLNFTVGPVQSHPFVLDIGAEQVPYFRTAEFSAVMLENEALIKKFAYAPENARAVFITGSGTASMEAVVINLFDEHDKILVVNGGSFGQRFVELCEIHKLDHTQIKLNTGESLTREHLKAYENKGYTAFLVNIHETSTGVHYDLDMIGEFCNNNNIFLAVDAISSFLADPIHMENHHIGVLITGSQKALACPPGVSVIVLNEDALKRVQNKPTTCMYLDLRSALSNAERGQTPFTPAVGTLLQIHARLKQIEADGGVEVEIAKVAHLAADFRRKIADLPFEITSESMSNAVTPLRPLHASAYQVFLTLKDEYDIWVCPNGGALADTLFRVGHIGALTSDDNDVLINALNDMKARNLL